MSSLKKNFFFDVLNTTSSILFPLITFPYVSRILQAEGLGTIAFLGSIIDYIILFVGLGIPVYGVREIAKVKGNKWFLAKTSKELLTIHSLMGLFGYFIVVLLAFFVPQINQNIIIFLILSLGILLNVLGVNWFFSATEQFAYITIRGLIVRCLSLVALFLFVHTREDIVIYCIVNLGAEAGNYLVNFWKLNRTIDLWRIPLRSLELKKHVPSILNLFISSIAVTIYFNLDNIMIGFIQNEESVGYYAPALKIQRLLMGVIISIGTVVFPRLSSLSKEEDKTAFSSLSARSTQTTLSISIPLAVTVLVLAKHIVFFLAGESFTPSILTLQLLAPVIILGSLSNVTAKILISQGHETIMTMATVCGAVVNLLLNAFFIYLFSHRGAALASSLSELCVCTTMIFFGRQFLSYRFLSLKTFKYIIASGIMGFLIFVTQIADSYIYTFVICSVLGVFSYLSILAILKDDILIPIVIDNIKKVIKYKK